MSLRASVRSLRRQSNQSEAYMDELAEVQFVLRAGDRTVAVRARGNEKGRR
jgi:hypothetical protein